MSTTRKKLVTKPKPDIYRVWVRQVNQSIVEVFARSPEEAREKGYRKWRRDEAHSSVSDVAKC